MNWYTLTKLRYDFKFENPDKVRAIHSDLYFYIVDKWNRLGQKEKFWLPTQMTMELLGIWSYNTYQKTYSDLVEWWFIREVRKSLNQHYSRIIALSKIDKAPDKALDKATAKATDEAPDKATDTIIEYRNNKWIKEWKNENFSLLRGVWKNCVAKYKLTTWNKATPWNREKARQSYMKSNATLEQVKSAIELYFKEKTTNKEYVQHFSTWLNQKWYEQERSDDEPPVYTQDHVTRFFQNKLGETYTTIPDPQLPEIYPWGQLCRAEDYRRSYISRLNHTKRIEWNKDRDKLKNLYNANPLTYCDE